jgi:HEAT repeat protein
VFLSGIVALALAVAFAGTLRAADAPGDELVEMIVTLVSDQDRDMRAVGLQQVREEAKGAAATRKFSALLPKLPTEAQAGLLDALGDRGDNTARPAVLEMLRSQEEPVRAAALRALGTLGDTADVPLLAKWLAAVGAEKTAAKAALVRLHGQGVSAAIIGEAKQAKPEIRIDLLGVLAARGATDGVPLVLEAAGDADAGVRLAALAALRALAGKEHAAAVVKVLKAAKDSQEQWQAETALLTVCTRGREGCVDAILAGMADAGPAAAESLLRALARSGGDKALGAIVAATKDERPAVGAEAVRVLAYWRTAEAIPHLLAIAKQAGPIGHHATAVQGLIRLASPVQDRPANMALLGEAMKLARRSEEKRMVLGVLGGVATKESLALVTPAMDDPDLTDEACLAAVLIAQKLPRVDQATRRAVFEKAAAKAKDRQIRERAKEAIKGEQVR